MTTFDDIDELDMTIAIGYDSLDFFDGAATSTPTTIPLDRQIVSLMAAVRVITFNYQTLDIVL